MHTRIPLPDDVCPSGDLFDLHVVDDLADLVGREVLEEVVVHQGFLDQLLGSRKNVKKSN